MTLETYNASSYSDRDGLGTITGTELLHNVLNMSLYRFLRDEKAPGPSKTSAADIAARLKAVNVLMWLFAPAIKNDEMPAMR